MKTKISNLLADSAFAEDMKDPTTALQLSQAVEHLLQSTSYANALPQEVFRKLLARAVHYWREAIGQKNGNAEVAGTTLRECFSAIVDEWYVDVHSKAPDQLNPILESIPASERDDKVLILEKFFQIYGTL